MMCYAVIFSSLALLATAHPAHRPPQSTNVAEGDGPDIVSTTRRPFNFTGTLMTISKRTKELQQQLTGAQKAYSTSGVLGVADYIISLQKPNGPPPPIKLDKAHVVKHDNTSMVVVAPINAQPLGGQPLVFNLTEVVPKILEEVLETVSVKDAAGQDVTVVTVQKPRDILLNVTTT